MFGGSNKLSKAQKALFGLGFLLLHGWTVLILLLLVLKSQDEPVYVVGFFSAHVTWLYLAWIGYAIGSCLSPSSSSSYSSSSVGYAYSPISSSASSSSSDSASWIQFFNLLFIRFGVLVQTIALVIILASHNKTLFPKWRDCLDWNIREDRLSHLPLRNSKHEIRSTKLSFPDR